jgi:hypothetical protein
MKIKYQSNGKTIEGKLEGSVVKASISEIGPDLYRFKTINALKQVNILYKKDINEAR